MNPMEDDDSENDSDFVPDEDVLNEETSGSKRKPDGGGIVGINKRRQQQATSIWEELQAEDRSYIQSMMEKSLDYSLTSLERPCKRMRRRAEKFFKTLGRSKSSSAQTTVRKGKESVSEDLREKSRRAVEGLVKKTKVEEKRKFAGQEIIVQSTIAMKKDENTASKPSSSLDEALNLIKGPKTINTVSKSSADWENFKEKEGLQDDLAHSKENYLEKKEFLDRCDYRNFEQQRDERLAKQAQNMP